MVQRAREVSETSARYNLARVETDPFVAMGFFQAVFRPRFRFRGGDEKDDLGPDVRMVRFDERQRPTVLRTPTDNDLPSRGRIWLEQTTGRVVKTELVFNLGRHRREVLTSYRWDDDLQMHVLGEVRDAYSTPFAGAPKVAAANTFRGVATYSRFRRFQVRTQQTIR